MRAFIVSILGVLLVLGAPLHAETPVDLRAAQTALAQGQYDQARANALAIQNQHPVDAALIYAKASLELGLLDDAERAANEAIRLAPALADPRVMKGLIRLRKGQPRRALFHLRRGLDLSRIDLERTRIRQILRNTQAQLRLQFFGGVGLAPSSNVAKVTSETEFDPTSLAGGNLNGAFNPGISAESGVGAQFWFGANYRLYSGPAGGLNVVARLGQSDYQGSEFDNRQLTTALTWTLPNARQTAQTQIGLQSGRFMHETSDDYRFLGISIDHRIPLGASTLRTAQQTLAFSYKRLGYRYDVAGLHFDQNTYGLGYARQTSPRTRWSVDLTVQDRQAISASIANEQVGLTVGTRRAIGTSGWVTDISASLRYARWDGLEFGFAEKRWERDLGLSVGFENPNISYFGFTPSVRFSALERTSNQNIREFDSQDIFIGFQNAF